MRKTRNTAPPPYSSQYSFYVASILNYDFEGMEKRLAALLPNKLYKASLIITEIGELFELALRAKDKGPELFDEINFLEETSDVLFYLAVADKGLGLRGGLLKPPRGNAHAARPQKLAHDEFLVSLLWHSAKMASLAARFLDKVLKKHVEFAKDYDRDELIALLRGVSAEVDFLLAEGGYTMEDAMRANYEKLIVRFPAGYSPANASEHNRAAEHAVLEERLKRVK